MSKKPLLDKSNLNEEEVHVSINDDHYVQRENAYQAGGVKPSSSSAASIMGQRQSVFLEFEKISATVHSKKILHSVSGFFPPGSLTAIIGTSGAGKTTLLNILAGFQSTTPGMKVTGTVKVNGEPRKMRVFRKNSAFIMQDDILTPTFTPQEALMFCANIRLPETMNERTKHFAVQTIIEQLGMKNAKDVVTGHPEGEKGLSGGQRKRLSIALELLTQPPLLFLDEPTSGLDSATSLALGKLLKDLANAGRTIICTIHQPSSTLFHLFDQVIVMSQGEIAYMGPTKTVTHCLEDIGIDCPQFENPSEWILTMAVDPQVSMFLVDQYQTAAVARRAAVQVPPPLVILNAKLPMMTKFRLLYKRCITTTVRDKVLTRARAGAHVMMGILIGLLYLKLDSNQDAINDRVAMAFFSLIFLMLVSLMPTVLTFPTEKAVFLREYQNNWYGVGVYYIAKSFADLPLQIWFPFIYGLITFFMTNVYDSSNPHYVKTFFKYEFILVLQTCVAQAMGVVIGIAAPNLQTGVFASPMIATPNLLFCGFLVKTKNIFIGLRWIQYLCYIKFALQGAIIALFEEARFKCTEKELYLYGGRCPIQSGKQIIAQFGYDDLSYGECVGILFAYFVIFRVLGYYILKRKLGKKDK